MKSLGVALLAGALVNVTVAQLIGWFPGRHPSLVIKFVRADDGACEVTMYPGVGRSTLMFRMLTREGAAIWQRIHEKQPEPEQPSTDPVYAGEGEVPDWCSVWRSEQRALERAVHTEARAASGSVCPLVDVGIGLPFISFSASLDPRVLTLSNLSPPPVLHGGYISDPLSGGHYNPRVLAWRPVWRGLVLGSLAWGAIFWFLGFVTRSVHAIRRRRGGLCLVCGYQRAGLPLDSTCPECGDRPQG